MKLFGKKNRITAVMDAESPKKDLLGEARAQLLADNPPNKRRKRFILHFAYAAAPIVVIGVIATVYFTVVLPGDSGLGCGASQKSSGDMAEMPLYDSQNSRNFGYESDYAEFHSINYLGNVLEWMPLAAIEKPDTECFEYTTEAGITYIYYYKQEEGVWEAYTMLGEQDYILTWGNCTEEVFLQELEKILIEG